MHGAVHGDIRLAVDADVNQSLTGPDALAVGRLRQLPFTVGHRQHIDDAHP